MASNNASYPYQQRPSQGQGFQQQGGYNRPPQEYSTPTQRWPDYPAPQNQYEQPQHRQPVNMGGPVGAGRTGGNNNSRDTVMGGMSTGGTAQGTTRTASPTPGHSARQSQEFGAYPNYTIGNTIASHVQSYAQQTPTSIVDMAPLSSSGPPSRARTTTAAQPLNGYQYTGNFGQTTSAMDIPLPYRTSGGRVEEYFDYTSEPTTGTTGYGGVYQTADPARTAAGYGSIYQTADSTRNAQAASSGYSPLYQSDVTRQQTAASGYGSVYQTQQAGRQGARTVTPVQTQHQPQPSHTVTPAQTQRQPRTVTPSQTQHQSSRTVMSQTRQAPQSYSPATTVQQPQQSQYEAFPPTQRTSTPTIPQRNTATPPTPTTTQQPASQPAPATKPPKAKPKSRADGLVINSWAPPGSNIGTFASEHPAQRGTTYEEQRNFLTSQNTSRSEPTRDGMSQTPWEGRLKRDVGQAQGTQQAGHVQQPQGQIQAQAVRTSQISQAQQPQSWGETHPPAQVTRQASVPPAPIPQPQPQNPPQFQEQREMYHRHTNPQSQYHHAPPVPTTLGSSPMVQTAPEPEVQYPTMQPQAQPLPQPQPQYQQQREPEPQLQAQPQYQTPPPSRPELPREAPPRAPSEPRAPPPLNKELMEQQMKVMVERMRYYQAADPATFQAVWDNVRKSAQAGPVITAGSSSHTGGNEGQGGDRKAIMPSATGGNMARSESTASERTVVYTPSQAPQVPVGGAKPNASAAGAAGAKVVDQTPRYVQQHQESRQVLPQQVESPTPAPSIQHLQPQQPQTQHVPPSQPRHQPAPVVPTPQKYNPLPPPPPQPDAMHIRTAKAVSKYLTKTSGHCLPEEVIMDLLHRIKSFPALCDKLEAMGYQFHRGNFSRFLLAEVDGDKEEEKVEEKAVVEEKEVVVDMMEVDEADEGCSRVLGEVEDDQEQIMREINEARNKELQAATSSPTPVIPAEATTQPVKKGRGRPRKSAAPTSASINLQQASSSTDPAAADAPKTPTVPANIQRTALPTPMSAVPTAPLSSIDGAVPVVPTAAHPTPIFRPNTRPPPPHTQPQSKVYNPLPLNQQPPSPGPDYTPMRPTPQSVKAAHTAPSRDPEMKQFVSPSLVYRPPTPPPLVIDVDSSPSPPPAEIYSPTTIGGAKSSSPPTKMPAKGKFMPPNTEKCDHDAPSTNEHERRASLQSSENTQDEGSDAPKLTKIVKLRLKSLESLGHNSPAAESPPPAAVTPTSSNAQPAAVSKAVTIDLTASATPEPQMNRASQLPASAPDPRNFHETERQLRNPPTRSSESTAPSPIQQAAPIPQSAPAKQSSRPTTPSLFIPIDNMKPLKRTQYDPATIARDVQIATGRNPQLARPLNSHLEILRLDRRFAIENADLSTLRWDILDPDPVRFTVGYDARIDDDDDDGGFGSVTGGGESGGADVAAARASVMFSNPTAMKGMADQATVPSPTPAGRGRGRRRSGQSILGASVLSYQNSEHGSRTVSNGADSADGRRRAASANGNSNTNGNTNDSRTNGSQTNGSNLATTGGGSWGGFSVPAPRSSSRTGSGLRNVITPDAGGGSGSGNFAVVIRSPSVSSVDRNRAPDAANAKNLKRKLDDSDKEKGTPATKRAPKPAKEKSPPRRIEEEEPIFEMRPSGFKVFKCRWKFCPAELHNFETLHRHVIKTHRKLADYGGYPCHWEGCSRSPTKEMKKSAASNRGLGKVVAQKVTWDFDTPEQWETHVVQSHLEGVKNEIGVGPSVGPFDHEAVISDIDYLSDSFGRQITPVARLAPVGHVFLPPPGYESSSPHSTLIRHVQRARALGAGMEGDETADLRENDDGVGIGTVVRRIVAAEDGAIGLHGGGSSRSPESARKKAKGKDKGKERAVEKEKLDKEKPLESSGGGSNGAGPSNGGAFTVYDDEEYSL